MKQKTKLLIFVSSFCLVIATCLLSVFAVKNFNVNMTGEIEFIAPGIEATISAATLSGVSKKRWLGANAIVYANKNNDRKSNFSTFGS